MKLEKILWANLDQKEHIYLWSNNREFHPTLTYIGAKNVLEAWKLEKEEKNLASMRRNSMTSLFLVSSIYDQFYFPGSSPFVVASNFLLALMREASRCVYVQPLRRIAALKSDMCVRNGCPAL